MQKFFHICAKVGQFLLFAGCLFCAGYLYQVIKANNIHETALYLLDVLFLSGAILFASRFLSD